MQGEFREGAGRVEVRFSGGISRSARHTVHTHRPRLRVTLTCVHPGDVIDVLDVMQAQAMMQARPASSAGDRDSAGAQETAAEAKAEAAKPLSKAQAEAEAEAARARVAVLAHPDWATAGKDLQAAMASKDPDLLNRAIAAAQAKAEANAEANAEAQAKAKAADAAAAQAKAKAEAEVQAEAKAKDLADVKAKAQAMAEAEAEAKAEADRARVAAEQDLQAAMASKDPAWLNRAIQVGLALGSRRWDWDSRRWEFNTPNYIGQAGQVLVVLEREAAETRRRESHERQAKQQAEQESWLAERETEAAARAGVAEQKQREVDTQLQAAIEGHEEAATQAVAAGEYAEATHAAERLKAVIAALQSRASDQLVKLARKKVNVLLSAAQKAAADGRRAAEREKKEAEKRDASRREAERKEDRKKRRQAELEEQEQRRQQVAEDKAAADKAKEAMGATFNAKQSADQAAKEAMEAGMPQEATEVGMSQDWRSSVEAHRPQVVDKFKQEREKLYYPLDRLVAPGGDDAARETKLNITATQFETVQWRDASSRHDYTERLANKLKELEAQVPAAVPVPMEQIRKEQAAAAKAAEEATGSAQAGKAPLQRLQTEEAEAEDQDQEATGPAAAVSVARSPSPWSRFGRALAAAETEKAVATAAALASPTSSQATIPAIASAPGPTAASAPKTSEGVVGPLRPREVARLAGLVLEAEERTQSAELRAATSASEAHAMQLALNVESRRARESEAARDLLRDDWRSCRETLTELREENQRLADQQARVVLESSAARAEQLQAQEQTRRVEQQLTQAGEQLGRARGELAALQQLDSVALSRLEVEAKAALRRIEDRHASVREEESLCPICFDQRKDTALVPCGHQLCHACQPSLPMRSMKQHCPLCQTPVDQHVRLYP